MEKLNFDTHFQNGIVKLMLKDQSFALKCLNHLNQDYFENKYLSWIFGRLNHHNDTYGHPASGEFIWDQIKTIKQEEQESYKACFHNIAATDLQDNAYLRDELTKFIQTREFVKMHSTEAEMFNSGKHEEAFNYVTDQITKIKTISFNDNDFIQGKDIDKILEELKNSRTENIPTGITAIDKELSGGLPKQSVTTVLGAWNVGKSIVGINLAYFAAMAEKKVLYIFHEGRKNQVVARFLSRITGIAYNNIVSGIYNEDPNQRKKIKDAKAFIEKFIRIREMRKVGVSIEDVVAYAKSTMDEWPFDELIDDYGQKLITGKRGFRELRHVQGHIWHTFDLLSAELNIAVVTFGQLNREYVKFNRKGSQIVRSEGVSECAGIAHVSETILTINKSPQDEGDNKLIVCLDKCRDARAGLLIGCNTNFSNMRAYDKVLGFEDRGYDIPTDDKEDDK